MHSQGYYIIRDDCWAVTTLSCDFIYVLVYILAMKLHYGDLTDSSSLVRLIAEVQPTEIYNLAAQSHVKVSTST